MRRLENLPATFYQWFHKTEKGASGELLLTDSYALAYQNADGDKRSRLASRRCVCLFQHNIFGRRRVSALPPPVSAHSRTPLMRPTPAACRPAPTRTPRSPPWPSPPHPSDPHRRRPPLRRRPSRQSQSQRAVRLRRTRATLQGRQSGQAGCGADRGDERSTHPARPS